MKDISEYKRLKKIADEHYLGKSETKSENLDAINLAGAGVPTWPPNVGHDAEAVGPEKPSLDPSLAKKLEPISPATVLPEVTIQSETDPRLALEQLLPYLPSRSYAKAKRVMAKLTTDPKILITTSGKVVMNGSEVEATNGIQMLRQYLAPKIRADLKGQGAFNSAMDSAGYGGQKGAKKSSSKPKNPRWFYIGW